MRFCYVYRVVLLCFQSGFVMFSVCGFVMFSERFSLVLRVVLLCFQSGFVYRVVLLCLQSSVVMFSERFCFQSGFVMFYDERFCCVFSAMSGPRDRGRDLAGGEAGRSYGSPQLHRRQQAEQRGEWRHRARETFNDALNTFYLRLYGVRHMVEDHSDSERGRKEGNGLFNDTLNTCYLRLYGKGPLR